MVILSIYERYDIVFLILFTLFVSVFLFKHKKNLEKQGIIWIYRTKLGMKVIDSLAKKFKKFWLFLVPAIFVVGYTLMTTMVFMLLETIWIYIKFPNITKVIKAPPIAPLIPYFPKIFGMESFFPNFYFTYFLIALLIVAIVHEFSHGIYMRVFKTKIKSTGFAFLGPILGAFVEQDDKDFAKKKIKERMVVLGAGVFANIVFALVFFLILLGFFSVAYQPVGVKFNVYSPLEDSNNLLVDLNTNYNLTNFSQEGINYYIDNSELIWKNLGTITAINGFKISSYEVINNQLSEKEIGDKILINVSIDNKEKEYLMTLQDIGGRPALGFIFHQPAPTWKTKLLNVFKVKDPIIDYKSLFVSADFFYDLFWWIMLINFLVGLFNMLPLGILDGGQFFYLTILGLTKSEKIAKKSFKFVSKTIIIIFLVLLFVWLVRLF